MENCITVSLPTALVRLFPGAVNAMELKASTVREVIDQLNAAAAPKLAVDLPSGLDCDTGEPARHTIRAAETCTFVAAKPGFFAPGAEPYVGRLHVLDIGTPRKLVEEILRRT